MKRVFCRQEYCIACRLCEVYCTVAHSKSKDLIKAHKEETPRPKPRLKVQSKGEIALPVMCYHCPDPLCVYACPTNALSKNGQNGLVELDVLRCTGCWNCIAACPYGAIYSNQEQNGILKCDLCPHLPLPACVQNCPNGALIVDES